MFTKCISMPMNEWTELKKKKDNPPIRGNNMRIGTTETSLSRLKILGRVGLGENAEKLNGATWVGFWLSV